MYFGCLVGIGFGFIDKFKIYPSHPDYIIMVQLMTGDSFAVHQGSVRAPLILDKILNFITGILMFDLLNHRVQGTDYGVIDENIAVRCPADGQTGAVEQTFVDCYTIMQLND
jgi:hypothetical protein